MTRRSSFLERFERWQWLYFFPLVAAVVLVIGIPQIPESIAAAKNQGLPGSFTSVRVDCGGKGGCSHYGSFVSDDGSIRLSDVFIEDGVEQVGESVSAQYLTGSDDTVFETGSRGWIWLTLLVVGALLFLLYWGWRVVWPRIRRSAT